MLGEDDVVAGAAARIGTVLRDKYRLDRVLGVGGMASVYAATHRNAKRFAVKVLHPELSLRPDIRTRFLREGYAANTVDHPGVVAVLDDDVSEDGAAFLVMELLEGETVDDFWKRSNQRVSIEIALSIGYQLLDILGTAHARGIVHRDIKPANLFLTFDGRLKVLDFGIARVRDIASSNMTKSGALFGTPSFMSPEQALGRSAEVDAATDIWAAGAVLFSLMAGRFVHDGESGQEIMVLTATTQAQSLAGAVKGAPRAVVQIIDRALAYDKAARWPSAKAMALAIRDANAVLFNRTPSLPPEPLFRDATSASSSGASRPPLVWTPEPSHLTTAQPVSSEPMSARSARTAKIGVAIFAALGGLLGLGCLALILGVGRTPSSRVGSAPPEAQSAYSSPPAASAPTPPAPTAAAPSGEPPPTETVPSATPPVRAAPPAAMRPVVAAPPPPVRVSAPAPQRAPNAGCIPPYTLDPATGRKKWKPECLWDRPPKRDGSPSFSSPASRGSRHVHRPRTPSSNSASTRMSKRRRSGVRGSYATLGRAS